MQPDPHHTGTKPLSVLHKELENSKPSIFFINLEKLVSIQPDGNKSIEITENTSGDFTKIFDFHPLNPRGGNAKFNSPRQRTDLLTSRMRSFAFATKLTESVLVTGELIDKRLIAVPTTTKICTLQTTWRTGSSSSWWQLRQQGVNAILTIEEERNKKKKTSEPKNQ